MNCETLGRTRHSVSLLASVGLLDLPVVSSAFENHTTTCDVNARGETQYFAASARREVPRALSIRIDLEGKFGNRSCMEGENRSKYSRNPPRVINMVSLQSALLDAVCESDLLADLEKDVTHDILAAAQIRRVPPKQIITTQGDRVTHLFLVGSGRVRFYHLTKQGSLVLLAWLMPGDVIGLLAILKHPFHYMASAEATSDCELFTWDHSLIRKIVSRHPVLAENALRISLGYLRSFVNRHIGLVTKTAEQRLAETLLRLGEQCGEVHPDGIEIHTTNEQLGGLAGVGPFTTSRMLSNWVRSGTVSKGRGRILLQAPEALMID